jgi:glycosyltransferase involved in cell wall biosynthesis
MPAPFFTIIIPSFNSEKTLQNVLDSILCQEFNDFEVVVVDGLSADNTLQILRENSGEDHRIRFISEKDKGIFDAMNKGISMAKGSWLYFIGSDDSLYDKNVFRKVSNALKESPCDFLYGDVYSDKMKGIYGGRFDEDKIMFSNICHQAIFYKKEVFELIGFYNITYTSFADWEFNIRCFLETQLKKCYLDIIVSYFAMGGTSMVNPDLFFLRNYLFSKNLSILNAQGIKKLHSIRIYDKWWRLIRSLKLTQYEVEIARYANGESIPVIIEKMASFQRRIPYRLLRIGVISKTLMLVSYCTNLVMNRF